MQKDIHPTYYSNAIVTCACGNTFKIGSTQENIEVEVCSACHPFYTGKQKIIDTARRVDRFEKRAAQAGSLAKERKGRKVKHAETKARKKSKDEKSKTGLDAEA